MTPDTIICRLRTLRQRSGLTEDEVATALGSVSNVSLSRHERSSVLPSLVTAIGYEVIFQASFAELFPGLYQTIEAGIEERLARLEAELHQSNAKGRPAAMVARKLEFLCERKEVDKNAMQ
jgi:DNA-binding XRE family transcriptional regulator